jgi:hypothetical protein
MFTLEFKVDTEKVTYDGMDGAVISVKFDAFVA